MHFVITGKINCPQYTYAVMVAQRLKENLPDFTYMKIPKKPNEWDRWLCKLCKENNWNHIQSPLIWREIGLKQGKKDFIGDINKFLDLCYDYYGIPREILSAESFNKGEMEWFTNRTESEFFENINMEAKRTREYRARQICVTGASSQAAEIVVMELLQIPIQTRKDGLEIRLFDEPMKERKLESSANDANYCPGLSGFGNCRVTTTLKEALTNVDLVIVLDSFSRKPRESVVKWLKRNRNAMCALGKGLNTYAPPHCRVIIGGPSNQPICYNATVLASFATRLHVRNIVAVTQDLGREMLKPLSLKLGIPLKDFYCPPVWGFVGLNKVVDIGKTLQTHLYKVPGKRMYSTLPQGSEEYEVRETECLMTEDDTKIHVNVSSNKIMAYPQLGRWPCLAKATAILDLLRVWGLKQEDGNGEILCLGVYSDGTFNIPQGIYWSQPVILKNGFWVPFEKFPIPRSVHINYHSLFLYSIAALYRTKVKPRRYVPPNSKAVEKNKKKFNFDEVLEKVGMPAIRNDTECVEYLKYLAKKELGVDLDAPTNILEEEAEEFEIKPPIEIKREQIYCECWRQELKELQKIVFDRSSTTEVEMDLSDNLSGSEWSVINPNPKESHSSVISKNTSLSENILYAESAALSKESSAATVCTCGAINDSLCHCLNNLHPPKDGPEKEGCVQSTEHFYKEQNVEVYVGDLQDVIYEDTYPGEKHVSFEVGTKHDSKDSDFHLQFYGKKDAIRDKQAELNRKVRILKYERGSEESVGEEEEKEEKKKEEGEGEKKSEGEERRNASFTEKINENDSIKDEKFHITIEGVSYDIIGSQIGLEGLEEIQRNSIQKESGSSFREMYKDEVMPSLQIVPPDETGSENSSYKSKERPGEDNFIINSYRGTYEGSEGKSTGHISSGSLGEDFEVMWGEDRFHEGALKEDEMDFKEKPKKERKREGIPLCCLCRCIVPEGLVKCLCGATTVVEVFKKESVDVLIENEDDLTFRVEYFETILDSTPPDTYKFRDFSAESSTEVKPVINVVTEGKVNLPPESFLPFSQEPENKFMESLRPKEFSKDDSDFSKKTHKKELPEKCAELLTSAKMQLQEQARKKLIGNVKKGGRGRGRGGRGIGGGGGGEEEEEEEGEGGGEVEDEEEGEEEEEVEDEGEGETSKINRDQFSERRVEEEDNDVIKNIFSDLKMFIPDGLEDWRITVQRKYRDWFFQGSKIRNESYYDIAIEEVSEDEFDIDKELEQYFEI